MFTFDSSSKGPLIGVGGENRVIFVFDSRKWNVKGTWSSCQKYEVIFFFQIFFFILLFFLFFFFI